jgi:hypothetical protein
MGFGRLPLDEQLAGFRALVTRNPTLVEVLTRAAGLALPGWYLVAGCLYQTVWNVVTGQPPESGILDYDLAYFDGSDLSWHAEDAIIQEGCRLFGDLPAPVQVRNQARVHLWYEQKFGGPVPATRLSRGGDRHIRGNHCLPWPAPSARRALARLRSARAGGRVQPRRPAQPGAGAPPCLPGQDHPVAAAMAISHSPALARARRRHSDLMNRTFGRSLVSPTPLGRNAGTCR